MLKEIFEMIPASICILSHEIKEEFTDLVFSNLKFKENFGVEKNFDLIKKNLEKIKIFQTSQKL